jgi:hypothetical protein
LGSLDRVLREFARDMGDLDFFQTFGRYASGMGEVEKRWVRRK